MSALVVGSVLENYADYDRVPVGTIITPRGGGQEFEKHVDGWRARNNPHAVYGINDFSMGYNTIASIPKGKVTWESLAQWQFRYRDNCYASAESAGVSTETVAMAMEELGIGDDQFPLGRGVTFSSEHDKYRLPVGAQVTVGIPDRVEAFGLFVKGRAGWNHLLGEITSLASQRVTVVTGEEPGWYTTPGTEGEQTALANFKAKAWRTGWKVKVNHRWCESYENYMGRIGLTESVLREVEHGGITVGERVGPQGAACLPAGSILRWHHRSVPDTFTWYIRDDYASNEARTRVLFGHRADGAVLRNSGPSMEVMWIADADDVHMSIEVDSLDDIWEYLPVGTRLRVNGGIDEFVVCHDHRVTGYNAAARRGDIPATGPWTLEQVGSDVRISGFPS